MFLARLIGTGKLDRQIRDFRRQIQCLRLDLEDCRADHDDIPGKQPDGAKLDFASLAQDFGLKRQRRHRHWAHQIDGHARDLHRLSRRDRLGGPYHQCRRRGAVLHTGIPGAGSIRTCDDAIAVHAIDGVH